MFCTYNFDVDECATATGNNCDDNTVCENTIGSITCTCNTGFDGDGVGCAGQFCSHTCILQFYSYFCHSYQITANQVATLWTQF